jgi:anti-sigma-K factor RskA
VNDKEPGHDSELSPLSGAYALHALSADEAAEFERTLARNPELRWEVTELIDTAVELGLATAPHDPPAELKARLMEQIASTPQLPRQIPVVDAASAPSSPAETLASPADALSSPAKTLASPAAQKAQSRWFASPLTALVAIAAVVSLVVGGGILSNVVSESREQNVQANRLAAINAADDMQQAVSDVAGGGTATLVWSNELLTSAVIVDGLAPLPESKVYELWYIGESGPRAAGTFTVDESGTSWRVLDGEMEAGDTVGVTVEPRGGSTAPTTDPIVAITSA